MTSKAVNSLVERLEAKFVSEWSGTMPMHHLRIGNVAVKLTRAAWCTKTGVQWRYKKRIFRSLLGFCSSPVKGGLQRLNWTELQFANCSQSLTRVTNNASCNWVMGQFQWLRKQFESEGPIFWRRNFFGCVPHTLYTMSPYVSTEVAHIIRRTLSYCVSCTATFLTWRE